MWQAESPVQAAPRLDGNSVHYWGDLGLNRWGTAIAAGLLSVSTSAQAQWLYQGQESAFGDDTMHVALTALGPYALGLRCKAGTFEAVYITPERSDEGLSMLNMLKPQLRVRVDNQSVLDLDAELEDADGKLVVLAEIDRSLAEAVRDARRRVAVVVEVLGQRYHERSFNVRGSTNAVGKVMANCLSD